MDDPAGEQNREISTTPRSTRTPDQAKDGLSQPPRKSVTLRTTGASGYSPESHANRWLREAHPTPRSGQMNAAHTLAGGGPFQGPVFGIGQRGNRETSAPLWQGRWMSHP